jgi:hypothetical protein
VLRCGGGSDLFVTTHEGVAARHRGQRRPRHRFGLVLDLFDPLGSFSSGVAEDCVHHHPPAHTEFACNHAQGQVADLRGGFCPRVGLGLGPISVVLYSDANPRNHTIVRSRGVRHCWRRSVQLADDVEDGAVPLGAWLPAGPAPNPEIVVMAAKLESSSTVTSVPSAFFMWTS